MGLLSSSLFTACLIVPCAGTRSIQASLLKYVTCFNMVSYASKHCYIFVQFFNDRSCQKDVRSFVVLCKCQEKFKIEDWEVKNNLFLDEL